MVERSPADRRPSWWEWLGVLVLLLAVVWFGHLTLYRSAYWGRMTDFGVYARAGWAVVAGEDPYAVADDNKWHFVYPPPAALLFVPFADPPHDYPRAGYPDYDVGVGIWYAISALLMAFVVHRFASTVLPGARLWSRRWLYIRVLPLDLCLSGFGYTLGRGQVNILLLAFLACLFSASMRQHLRSAGLWLAAAASLKVIPAVMGLYFLVRREWVSAAASLVGTFLFCFVVPALVWGPSGSVEMNRRMIDAVLLPGIANQGDDTRAKELTDHTATDSQSFQAIIQNWRYPEIDTRPDVADPVSKLAHWVIVLMMLLVSAWAGFRAERSPANQLLVFGCMAIIMLLATPVSHMHYYVLAFPLVMGLIASDLVTRPHAAVPRPAVLLPLIGWAIATTLPLFPDPLCRQFRDFGLGTAATFALWLWGTIVSVRKQETRAIASGAI